MAVKTKKKLTVNQVASVNARILNHTDRIVEIKQTKKIRPITIHLAPTNKCNLTCSFCSTRLRGHEEIPIDDCIEIIDRFKALGLKSVEITGGGDPTMYKDLEELIHHISNQELGIGMITNGLRLHKIEEEALKKLDWMRISLSGIEFDMDDRYFKLDPSTFPEMTGCSLVVNRFDVETENNKGLVNLEMVPPIVDILQRADKISKFLGAKYVRIVPNCYNMEDIAWARKNMGNILLDLGHKDMFAQTKNTDTPTRCYWKYLKPFINADGYIYQCSTLSLFNQMFHPDWRVGHWTELEKIYNQPLESFNTSVCPYCFYSDQNQLISDLLVEKIITPSFV